MNLPPTPRGLPGLEGAGRAGDAQRCVSSSDPGGSALGFLPAFPQPSQQPAALRAAMPGAPQPRGGLPALRPSAPSHWHCRLWF